MTDSPRRAGLCTDIVAGGGLGTWDVSGANPRIIEIHVGRYGSLSAGVGPPAAA